MDDEIVSVVMAVYNTPAYMLMEAVKSIWNQTYSKIEFILVNDHSIEKDTIETIDVIMKEYPQTILIHNRLNYGLTRSLNIALEYCSGNYIVRMDADDISYPKRIEEQKQYMDSHPEVCIVGAQVEKFSDSFGREPIKYHNYTRDEKRFRIKMLFENKGPMHPTAMIRREFLIKNKITYRNEIKKAQDYALWIDCLDAGGVIKNLDIPLLKYRVHGSQISLKNSEEQQLFKRQIVNEQMTQIFGIHVEEQLKALSSMYSKTFEVQTRTYIEALKGLIEINKQKVIYDEEIFKDEIRQIWIHKCVKCLIKGGDISGFIFGFTWKCLLSRSFVRWIKERVLWIS